MRQKQPRAHALAIAERHRPVWKMLSRLQGSGGAIGSRSRPLIAPAATPHPPPRRVLLVVLLLLTSSQTFVSCGEGGQLRTW